MKKILLVILVFTILGGSVGALSVSSPAILLDEAKLYQIGFRGLKYLLTNIEKIEHMRNDVDASTEEAWLGQFTKRMLPLIHVSADQDLGVMLRSAYVHDKKHISKHIAHLWVLSMSIVLDLQGHSCHAAAILEDSKTISPWLAPAIKEAFEMDFSMCSESHDSTNDAGPIQTSLAKNASATDLSAYKNQTASKFQLVHCDLNTLPEKLIQRVGLFMAILSEHPSFVSCEIANLKH